MEKQQPKRRRRGEGIFAILLCLASLWVVYLSYGIDGIPAPNSPGALPLGTALLLLGMMVAILVNTFRKLPPEPAQEQSAFKLFKDDIIPGAVPAFVLLILAYAVALETLGFFLDSFLFMLVCVWLFHRSGPLRALLISAGSLVLVYLIFHYAFEVRLPEGMLITWMR